MLAYAEQAWTVGDAMTTMPLMTTISEIFIPAPRAAIQRWLNNEIGGTALMRLLVSYGQWMAPISESAVGEMLQQGVPSRVMSSMDRQGVSRLFIFSDSDAYGEFSKVPVNAGQQHFLTTKRNVGVPDAARRN